jgi:hypothetical protein
MLSYPTAQDRGKYLGIWTAMRNLGTLVGGGINFGINNTNSSAGGVAWSTYLVFIGFEASGIFFAVFLSPTKKVRRPDGSRVPMSNDRTWRSEFVALWKHLTTPKVGLAIRVPSRVSIDMCCRLGSSSSRHSTRSSMAVPTARNSPYTSVFELGRSRR